MSITAVKNRSNLYRYTQAGPSPEKEKTLIVFLTLSLSLVLLFGVLMRMVDIPVPMIRSVAERQPVTIHLQPAATVTKLESPKDEVVAIPEIPVLEPETLLNAPVERAAPPTEKPAAAPSESLSPDTPSPARRVYGVRKVYARGFGKASSAASGLVTKKGNTVDGVADDLEATEADLLGELAALSSVEKAPQPLRRVKPVYSEAMLQAKVKGVVTAYLLVDRDGLVKDVKITQDIGFDSRQVAINALSRFKFEPALKNGQPVAVWILHRIRFEYQE